MSIRVRSLEVIKTCAVSPHLKRITLSGDDLADFPTDAESGYVKALFHPQGLPVVDADSAKGAVKRSYTVRAFRAETCELDIDFVLHGDSGPASAWATAASRGDTLAIAGPGPTKLADAKADWFAFFGDLSALPAISVNLQRLPEDSVGFAFLEVPSTEDSVDLVKPPGVQVEWIVNANPMVYSGELFQRLETSAWLDGAPYIWVAGEFELMRAARKKLKPLKSDVQGSYVSSYWKIGATQEGLQKAKALEEVKTRLGMS